MREHCTPAHFPLALFGVDRSTALRGRPGPIHLMAPPDNGKPVWLRRPVTAIIFFVLARVCKPPLFFRATPCASARIPFWVGGSGGDPGKFTLPFLDRFPRPRNHSHFFPALIAVGVVIHPCRLPQRLRVWPRSVSIVTRGSDASLFQVILHPPSPFRVMAQGRKKSFSNSIHRKNKKIFLLCIQFFMKKIFLKEGPERFCNLRTPSFEAPPGIPRALANLMTVRSLAPSGYLHCQGIAHPLVTLILPISATPPSSLYWNSSCCKQGHVGRPDLISRAIPRHYSRGSCPCLVWTPSLVLQMTRGL